MLKVVDLMNKMLLFKFQYWLTYYLHQLAVEKKCYYTCHADFCVNFHETLCDLYEKIISTGMSIGKEEIRQGKP